MNPYTPEPGHLIPLLRNVERFGWPRYPTRMATWVEVEAAIGASVNGLIEEHPSQMRYQLTAEGKAILARWRRRQPGGWRMKWRDICELMRIRDDLLNGEWEQK